MSRDKQQQEAFRVRQYAGPHPAAAAAAVAAGVAASPPGGGVDADAERVILHFDADSFYSQVEEVRDPSLRGRPVGVTQKYLVVTCNYEARSRGVTKLMAAAEARRRCPDIVLVSGEDLTPYREASKQIMTVLQRYGTAEKLGLDEMFVDATAEAHRRLEALNRSGAALPAWQGHLHSRDTQLVQDSRHRPMDLRAVAGNAAAAGQAGGDGGAASAAAPDAGWEALLRVGSVLAAEARRAVRCEAGYRTSAGIACNKMLAKLVSGLHKPDDQTVLPPPEAAAFVASLPVRALPGIGYKTEQALAEAGVATAADLRALPRHELAQRFGERIGAFLHSASRGKDPSPVQERGPPKSVTVEDSFKTCPGFAAAARVVGVLAPDLLARLQEELQGAGRRPATLTVKWRHRGNGWQRSSASGPMPAQALAPRCSQQEQVEALAAAAMALLRRHLHEPFDLSLLNLGATAFGEGTGAAAAGRSVVDMLTGGRQAGSSTQAAQAGPTGQEGPVQQQQRQQQVEAAPAPCARVAADASAQQRRSYGASPGRAPLLSKRTERQLREQAAQQQQQQQQGDQQHAPGPLSARESAAKQLHWEPPPPGEGRLGAQDAGASWQGHQAWPQAEPLAERGTAGYGFGAEGHEEEEEGNVWEELQSLAAWRSDGDRRRSPAAAPRAPASAGAARPAGAGSGSRPPAGVGGVGGEGLDAGRVVLHCDVDCFYCAVERLDDPSLRGVPLAVSQFNAGGFVAVSYEARAAGIRCGDGAGAAGRAAIPHLRDMQAASLEECRRRCPGLQVRPMRTDRYREVARQVHSLLRTFAPDGQVEKTSYDDFYLDVTAACAEGGGDAGSPEGRPPAERHADGGASPPPPAPPAGLLVLSGPAGEPGAVQERVCGGAAAQGWQQLTPELRRGALLAARLRAALQRQLGLTASCGVAANKLLARLASPLGKPDGLAVVPGAAAVPFIRAVPLRKVPQLRGKFGEAVASELGAGTVGDLAGVSRRHLARLFGEERGAFLAALPLAQDGSAVRERGPQKSLAAERSFPPLPSEAAAAGELAPLAATLLERAAQHAREHRRLPAKLVVHFRQGYGSNPRSRSAAVPPPVARWLAEAGGGGAAPDGPVAPPVATVAAAALALLRPEVAAGGWQLTRLAVALTYGEPGGGEQPGAGQQRIAAFVRRGGSPGAAERQQAGAGPPPAAARPAPAPAPAPARPGSYRNAEAAAIRQLFGGPAAAAAAAAAASAPSGLPPEERASLELAMRLQREEVAAAAPPPKRPAGGGGSGRAAKQRRGGGGPLDAFFRRDGA